MKPASSRTSRKAPRLARWATLHLMKTGVSAEVVFICGMVIGLVAGVAFMMTGDQVNTVRWWLIGLLCCSIRLCLTAISEVIADLSVTRDHIEDESYQQLPERVSDAVTLIGLGFAESSDPWLGLAAALLATLSSYLRALREAFDYRGFMNRKHRMLVVMLVSLFMIFGPEVSPDAMSFPAYGLIVIGTGCLFTILLRWLDLENRRP